MDFHIPLWALITVGSFFYLLGIGYFGPVLAFVTQGDEVRDWTMPIFGILWPVIVPVFLILFIVYSIVSLPWRFR